MGLRLTERVDLEVYYEADRLRFDDQVLAVVTREAFRELYAHCPSVGFERDGVHIGGVIFDGEAPHIAVLPQWQGRWGPLLKPMLRWLYSLKREIVIEVEDSNAPLRRFVEHCGWPAIGRTHEGTLHL